METSPLDIADIIERLGVIGGCIVAIWAFVTGKIWPQKVVEKMIDAQHDAAEKSAEIISQQICEKLANGVADGMERGIAKGYLKINGDS
jgi:hypothetical protein